MESNVAPPAQLPVTLGDGLAALQAGRFDLAERLARNGLEPSPADPSWLSVLALFVGLQIQVRIIEEPYLLRTHGDSYQRYAQSTGRFVPGMGRLHAQ